MYCICNFFSDEHQKFNINQINQFQMFSNISGAMLQLQTNENPFHVQIRKIFRETRRLIKT